MTEQFANTILNKLFELSTKIDTVSAVVKRHDEVTFPEIQKELKTQSNALFRMESKHNQDYLQYVEAKEAIEVRIKPLEVDFAKRQKTDEKIWDIVWRNIERFALWAGLIIFSWLYTHK